MHNIRTFALLVGMIILTGQVSARVNWIDKPVEHPPIPLLDEDGQHVLNTGKSYSPRTTCAGSGCHDYDKITSAYHFEMGRDEAFDQFGSLSNFLGANWLAGPGYFGGFTCMGGNNPTMLSFKDTPYPEMFRDMGAADFIASCSVCHAGGGYGEKDRDGILYTKRDPGSISMFSGDYFSRGHDENNNKTHDNSLLSKWNWSKSGLYEADCMTCHMSPEQAVLPDQRLAGRGGVMDNYRSVQSKLTGGGWFRDAATTAWEFLPTTDGKQIVSIGREWVNEKSYKIMTDDAGNPIFSWNPEAFDESGRVSVSMLRYPETENCMACHVTSNSRRGFYGYGEEARMELSEDGGTLVADYKDDVHKGADLTPYWQGESRVMDNCNICHSRSYLKPRTASINLDQNHDFMKGNSDMDQRNDLDFSSDLRTCDYCHTENKNSMGEPPIIPSGQSTMLGAHLERWKNSGSLAGYTEDSLNKVVQTHLDVLSCESCHITNVQSSGKPLQVMYRYRDNQEGKRKIIPYNPYLRYLWIDTVTGWALSKFERGLVVRPAEKKEGEENNYLDIIDPQTGSQLPGRLEGAMSHGSATLKDPVDAESYRSLKVAYDSLMAQRHGPLLNGRQPDVKMVWFESNEYIISHNVRPANEALDCAECHARKQNGSFSSLLSADGVFGSGNTKIVSKLPDPALVDEGVVQLGLPYMRVANDGTISTSQEDILFTTLVDPFMTINNAPGSRFFGGFLTKMTLGEMAKNGIQDGQKLLNTFGSETEFYGVAPRYGKGALQGSIVAMPVNTVTDALASKWRVEFLQYERSPALSALLRDRNFGELASDVVHISMLDDTKQQMTSLLGNSMIVKMPYRGRSTEIGQIAVVASFDGREIHRINPEDILHFAPARRVDGISLPGGQASNPDLEMEDGYVLFQTDAPGFFGLTDRL